MHADKISLWSFSNLLSISWGIFLFRISFNYGRGQKSWSTLVFWIDMEKDDFQNALIGHLIILMFIKYDDWFWSKRYDVSETSDPFIDFTSRTWTYRYLTAWWTKVNKIYRCWVYFIGKDWSNISLNFGLIISSLLQKLCILETIQEIYDELQTPSLIKFIENLSVVEEVQLDFSFIFEKSCLR